MRNQDQIKRDVIGGPIGSQERARWMFHVLRDLNSNHNKIVLRPILYVPGACVLILAGSL